MIIVSVIELSDEKEKVDLEKVEYVKGLVCGYCEYCKVFIYLWMYDRDLIFEYIYKYYICREVRNEVFFIDFFFSFVSFVKKIVFVKLV